MGELADGLWVIWFVGAAVGALALWAIYTVCEDEDDE